jgi:hypothetical protein
MNETVKAIIIKHDLELKKIELAAMTRLINLAKTTELENIKLAIFNDPTIYIRIDILEEQIAYLEKELRYVESFIYPES